MILLRQDHLDEKAQQAVFAVVRRATEADGINPLSEHVALHLRAGGDLADQHFILIDADEVVGYAHLDQTDAIAGPSAELVVDPQARNRGGGRLLVTELSKVAGPRLRLWSHGDLPAGETLARSLGFERIREVIQMRRSLELPLPRFEVPRSVITRRFDPARDIGEWLALNNRIFANHPEQGGWTEEDLRLRMAESWFDADGFLLACREDACIAFCWTKVHGADHHAPGHGHDQIGEIYVVGVDPDSQGEGLGRLMTLAGMNYLKSIGLRTVMLYVDSDNIQALGLYEALGYARWGTDVMYRRVQRTDTAI